MKKIDKNKIKTWFVTGASSGIGYELCSQLLARGYNVIAVSRRVPEFQHSNALCLSVDVTNSDSIKAAINQGIEKFGKIDVLSNNAGISANISLEEEDITHVKEVFETNYFGAFNTIQALLPHFRENKNGTIINNTSQSGISCRAWGTAYVSSKHALEGLTSVCWHEAQRFCRVMAFELGYFADTNIMKEAQNVKTSIKEYKNIPIFYVPYDRDFTNDIHVAIDKIISQVEMEKLPRRLMLGRDAIIQIGCEIKDLVRDWKNSKVRAYACSKDNKNFSAKIKQVWRKVSGTK